MEANSVTETERTLLAVHRGVAAGMARLFDLVADLDDTEVHSGYQSASAWLSWNLGLTGRTTRMWVRIARSLREFPLLRDAFAAGELSLEQLRVLLPIAQPDNQEFLIQLAGTACEVDDLRLEVKALELRQEEERTKDPADGPHLTTRWSNDRLQLEAQIPGADGILVDQALRRLAARAPRDDATGLFRDPETLNAEALIQMASESLASDGDHDRATIVVQISAEAIVAEEGESWDAATRVFTPDELRRIACDTRLQPTLHDSAGVTVGVGRTTRKIQPWLRRLLDGRDDGCRFPGCHRTRWLHGHHLVPWSQGGPTNLDNLVSLCGYHHRLIHNEKWGIEGNPNEELRFYNRAGFVHTPAKDRFPPDWSESLAQLADGVARHRLHQLANAPP